MVPVEFDTLLVRLEAFVTLMVPVEFDTLLVRLEAFLTLIVFVTLNGAKIQPSPSGLYIL